jgi:hypothetical protein
MKTKARPAGREGKNRIKIDPELLKQIDAVAAGGEPVGAVVMLRPDAPAQISASANRAEELTRRVLQRVEERVGSGANQVNVFRNLGIFAVSANPDFLRELLKQPEVASAMAHGQPSEAYIPPRDVKPVISGSSRGWASSESAEKPQRRSKSARPLSSKNSQQTTSSSKNSKLGKSKR